MGNRTAARLVETMYWVLIGTDESGSFPLLLTDEEALPGLSGSSVQWQLVARTRNQGVAARLMQMAHEDCHGAGRHSRGPSTPTQTPA
jgi:uncharacterized protein (DUF2236 family)